MVERKFDEWTNRKAAWSGGGPAARVMPMNQAAEGLKHRFKTEGSIKNGKDTLTEGIIEAASALAAAGLRRTDQHHGGGGVDPAKKLKNLMTGGPVVS